MMRRDPYSGQQLTFARRDHTRLHIPIQGCEKSEPWWVQVGGGLLMGFIIVGLIFVTM